MMGDCAVMLNECHVCGRIWVSSCGWEHAKRNSRRGICLGGMQYSSPTGLPSPVPGSACGSTDITTVIVFDRLPWEQVETLLRES